MNNDSAGADRINPLLAAALAYGKLGWKVFPIREGTKDRPHLKEWGVSVHRACRRASCRRRPAQSCFFAPGAPAPKSENRLAALGWRTTIAPLMGTIGGHDRGN
jgi:hypothetical protein